MPAWRRVTDKQFERIIFSIKKEASRVETQRNVMLCVKYSVWFDGHKAKAMLSEPFDPEEPTTYYEAVPGPPPKVLEQLVTEFLGYKSEPEDDKFTLPSPDVPPPCQTLEDVRAWENSFSERERAELTDSDYSYLPPGSEQIGGSIEEPIVRLASGLVVAWNNCHDVWFDPEADGESWPTDNNGERIPVTPDPNKGEEGKEVKE